MPTSPRWPRYGVPRRRLRGGSCRGGVRQLGSKARIQGRCVEFDRVVVGGAAMQSDAELEWISDCIFAVFQSPAWTGPIGKFVDENCGIFEDVEENKLEYTPIHNAFVVLVDDLLTASLMELSVTPEQFARFCEEGLTGNQVLHRSVIEKLLSVDDFLVFKAMMVKRNAELHRETLVGPSVRDEMGNVVSLEPDDVPLPPDGETYNEFVDATEAERLDAQRRCVEAELQLAIALSYQLEQRLRLIEAIEERLRLIEKLSEVLEATAEMDRQKEEALMAEASVAAAALAAPMPDIDPAPDATGAVAAALAPLAAAADLKSEEKVLPRAVQLQPLKLRGGQEGLQPPLPAPPPAPALSDAERWELEKKRSEAALQRAAGANRRAAACAAAEQRREEAAAAFAAAPEQAPPPPPAAVMPTEEERRARAEHLKRQREALVEKKNRERERQLEAFQHTNGSTTATRVAERRMLTGGAAGGGSSGEMARKLAAELSGQVQGPTPDEAEAAGLAEKEAAAAEMRRAITRQLKQTLTGSLHM